MQIVLAALAMLFFCDMWCEAAPRDRVGTSAKTVERESDGYRVTERVGSSSSSVLFVPHSVRGDGFAVLVDSPHGLRVVSQVRPPATFRLFGAGGSERVAAAHADGSRFSARILTGDSATRLIWDSVTGELSESPERFRPGIQPGRCGAPEMHVPRFATVASAVSVGDALRVVDLAVDTDFEYVSSLGGDVDAVVADVERIINEVSLFYEAEFGLRYELGAIVVRTAPNDPYTASNNRDLLDELAAEWNTSLAGVPRDTTHLFTGRAIEDDVIGSANIDVMCDTCAPDARAYGFSQTTFSPDLFERVCLTAHELGHNWGAVHCDGDGDCGLMCSRLDGCAADCDEVGSLSRGSIGDGIAAATCSRSLPTSLTVPICDVVGPAIDEPIWTFVQGVEVFAGALDAPTAPFVMELDGCCSDCGNSPYPDELRSGVIDLSGHASATVTLTVRDPDAGAGSTELLIEFLTNSGLWDVAFHAVPGMIGLGAFDQIVVEVPADSLHAGFRLRIRVVGEDLGGTWWIDDLAITSARADFPVLHVRADAPPGGDGSSWETALNDLQDALAAAECSLGLVEQIRVGPGTFTPDRGTGDRDASFELLEGLVIRGGYRGTPIGGDAFDPARFGTVLSGEIGAPGTEDNSFHVLTAERVDRTAVVESVTVADGNAASADIPQGGGLVVISANPTIRACMFRSNHAGSGGAIGVPFGGGVRIDDSVFFSNEAWGGAGGAIHAAFGASVKIERGRFVGNAASLRGGALSVDNSSLTLLDSAVWSNSAPAGSAIAVTSSNAVLGGCTIYANAATAGAAVELAASNAELRDSVLAGSTSTGLTGEQAQIVAPGGALAFCSIDGWTGVLGGTGNDGAVPVFVDPDGLDDLLGNTDDDLRLLPSSPIANSGDPSAESGVRRSLDGGPRVLCGRIDRGAYESGQFDWDCDGTLDLADAAALGGCITGPDLPGALPGCEAFDADSDGTIDLQDAARAIPSFTAPTD